VDELANAYNVVVNDLVDRHAPLKSTIVPVRHDAEWYTNALRAAKQDRRRCERRWRQTGLTVHKDIYMTKKAEVNRMTKEARTLYYRTLISDNQGNPRKMFTVVSTLLGKKKPRVLPPGRADAELAQEFGSFFIEKIASVRQSIDSDRDDPAVHVPVTPARSSASLNALDIVSEDEVRRIIMASPAKHCPLDPLPTWLLKQNLDALLPFITATINASLLSGVMPTLYKTARVVPLLKKPSLDPSVLGNYRPVSNLSFLSKVLERVVNKQLMNYMTHNGLHEALQSAYRKNHSTETALVRVQHDMHRNCFEWRESECSRVVGPIMCL